MTPNWLTDVFRSTGVIKNAEVIHVEPTVVSLGTGFLGQVARLSVTYDREQSGAPASIIGKFPAVTEGGRALGNAFDFYHREIRFYREIAADVGLRTPVHYFSAVDPKAREYILLIEDLAPAIVGDHLAGWTLEQAQLAIDGISTVHAKWWESPRLDAIGAWMPATDAPVQQQVGAAYPRAWGPFLELFGAALSPAVKAAGERIGQKALEIQSSLASFPRTLMHGDFRMDNLFFCTEKDCAPFGVIDWQIATIGRGAFDVAYLICGGTEPEVRRIHERALLERYHRTLEANGVQGYDFDQCQADYGRSALYHFMYVVIGLGTIDPGNERGMALFRAWLRRAVAALEDLNAIDLIPE